MMLDFAVEGSLARPTAHEYARETLRRAILRGELPGGTRLVQAEVAQRLAVSTTPVREALRDLATEGLVRLDAHRGGVVEQLTIAQVQEIFDIRRVLEVEAMRRAARAVTAETLARAEALRQAMRDEPEVGRRIELNRDFHSTLLGDVTGSKLVRSVRTLSDVVTPAVAAVARSGGRFEHTPHEHAELVEGIRSGDEDRAADVTLRHLESTRAELEAAARTLEAARAPAPMSSAS